MNNRRYLPGEVVILYHPPLMDGVHQTWEWYTRYTIIKPTGPMYCSYFVYARRFGDANSTKMRLLAFPNMCNKEEFDQAVRDYNYKKLMTALTKDY